MIDIEMRIHQEVVVSRIKNVPPRFLIMGQGTWRRFRQMMRDKNWKLREEDDTGPDTFLGLTICIVSSTDIDLELLEVA